jgi:hypothetical protein
MNYSHCSKDKQDHEAQKTQSKHPASLCQVTGLKQTNKPVKENKKNENGVIV